MSDFNEAIISIRPNFAEAILSGKKSVELRRRIPSIVVSTRLWIYATLPIGAVVGSAIVKRIIRGSPSDVWIKWGRRAGVDRAAYDLYFEGANEAVGLELSDVKRGRPVSIEMLRSIRAGFHPPQVIVRLTQLEAKSIRSLSKAK